MFYLLQSHVNELLSEVKSLRFVKLTVTDVFTFDLDPQKLDPHRCVDILLLVVASVHQVTSNTDRSYHTQQTSHTIHSRQVIPYTADRSYHTQQTGHTIHSRQVDTERCQITQGSSNASQKPNSMSG